MVQMNRKIVVFFLFFLMLSSVSSAGEWEQFYNSSSILKIKVYGDSLWCGTRGGVLLFNLLDSTFVQYINGLELPSSDVVDIAIDSRGSVWMAFDGKGIVRVDDIDSDPHTNQYNTSVVYDMLSDSITCLLRVEDDIYYGSSSGVAKFYENVHSREVALSDFTEGKKVYDIISYGDSIIVGYSDGVAIFSRKDFSITSYPLGVSVSLCIYMDYIYCLSDGQIYRLNGSVWDNFPTPDDEIISISSSNNKLYCISSSKVYSWNGAEWSDISWTYQEEYSLKHLFFVNYRIRYTTDVVSSIAVDKRGVPWVGGDWTRARRGTYLSFYLNGRWYNRSPAQLSHSNVIEMDVDPQGGVWVSTKYYGISYRSSDGRWVSYTKYRGDVGENGLSYIGSNLALLYDSEGNLWCNALNFDLDRIVIGDPLIFEDDEWYHYALDTGTITSNRFVKAKEDPLGNRWFLSDDVERDLGKWGINILSADGNNWLSINPEVVPEMQAGSVFDCVFLDGGTVVLAIRGYGVQMWYANGYDWDELSNLSDDFWTTILSPDELASTELNSLAVGRDGALWVGTASGLVRYKSGVIDSFIAKQSYGDEGLISANVRDIEFDGDGALWVATDKGLNRILPDGTIEAFTTSEVWESDFQFIYPSSVISPLCFHDCNSLQYDPFTNSMWVGTANGLTRVDLTPPPEEKIDLENLILYPNPVHISRGDDALKIANISSRVNIQVYNMEGELVHEAFGVGDGEVVWDLLTLNGYIATSGVYIVRIFNEKGSIAKKVAVVK